MLVPLIPDSALSRQWGEQVMHLVALLSTIMMALNDIHAGARLSAAWCARAPRARYKHGAGAFQGVPCTATLHTCTLRSRAPSLSIRVFIPALCPRCRSVSAARAAGEDIKTLDRIVDYTITGIFGLEVALKVLAACLQHRCLCSVCVCVCV